MDAIATDDVQSVARELIDTDRIAVTVLGPLDGLKITRNDLVC